MKSVATDDARVAAEGATADGAAPSASPVAGRAKLPSRAATSRDGIARVSSEQLFAGAAEVHIDHHGAVYRLKQTSLGKLILTK
jgi:hemin uptake protein HemP